MSNKTSLHHGNITLINNPDLCTLQTCDLDLAQVKYIASLAGNTLFLAIFIVLILAQLGLGFRYKTSSFTFAMISGLILEAIGYLSRVLMHHNPFDHNDFLIELVCLTIAPAFLTAALYLCLGRIVVAFGTVNSRFQPRTYTVIFCGCDLFSLVLQAIGGGIAATAKNGSVGVQNGTHIMVAGLAFQVFSLLLFAVLCLEFAWRVRSRRDTWNERYFSLVSSFRFKAFLWALTLAVLTIFVRCVFRVAELQGGFGGHLANDQVTFMILEGPMIIIAVTALTFFHPGIGFQGHWLDANFPWRPLRTLWKKEPRRSEKNSSPASLDNVGLETVGGGSKVHSV